MKTATLIIGLVIATMTGSPLFAHEDTVLSYKEGRLTGLPSEYSPAFFDQKTCTLKIKGRETQFSPYIKSLFEQEDPYDLYFSSSWYHDPKILPPYINMEIRFKNKDFKYTFLIDLDKLDLIYAHVTVQESRNSTRDIPINLSDGRGGKTTTIK